MHREVDLAAAQHFGKDVRKRAAPDFGERGKKVAVAARADDDDLRPISLGAEQSRRLLRLCARKRRAARSDAYDHDSSSNNFCTAAAYSSAGIVPRSVSARLQISFRFSGSRLAI